MAYQNDSEWRVETKLTTSTFTISPAELTIKEGASATSSLAALMAGVLAMISLAGVAVFAKRK